MRVGRKVCVGREVCEPRSYKRASRSCESSGLERFEDPGLDKSKSGKENVVAEESCVLPNPKSLARLAFGPVGREDAAGLCKKSCHKPFYNFSDFDPEDLLEDKFEEGATWRAIQTAPALFQQAPASAAAYASSVEGCRLTLTRLSGDVGCWCRALF